MEIMAGGAKTQVLLGASLKLQAFGDTAHTILGRSLQSLTHHCHKPLIITGMGVSFLFSGYRLAHWWKSWFGNWAP